MRIPTPFQAHKKIGLALALASLALVGGGCGSGFGSGSASGSSSGPIAAANGPQLGYFWNSGDSTLRPVLGIPGSSQIGQSVVTAGAYSNGAASSATDMALLLEPDGSLDVLKLPSGQPVHLTAKVDPAARIRFAPGGKAALLFASGNATVTVVMGLTSSPSVSTVSAPAAVLEASLSDTGSIAVTTSSTAGTAIRVIAASGAQTQVAAVSTLGGMAFSGDDLLIADNAANTLTLIRNASTAPAPSLVPTSALLNAAVALGIDQPGRWAVVANGGDQGLIAIDLSAQTAPRRIACNCAPVLAAPLSGAGTFRVTGPTGGPLWAVDVAAAQPRAFFIPALPGMAPGKPGVQP